MTDKIDCAGGMPCTTCPDKRACSRGCVRQPEFISVEFHARPPAAPEGEPSMYGILGLDGRIHFDEQCVGPSADSLEGEVECLNAGIGVGDPCYTVVPLYLAPPLADRAARAPVAADAVIRGLLGKSEYSDGDWGLICMPSKSALDAARLFLATPSGEPKPEPVSPTSAGEVAAMEARKDAAYLERNQVVAALAKCFPSGLARTAIEGWSEDWHGCVYIDLPTGQASWHFHDSHAYLFNGLPPYRGEWDGHTTDEKYQRLAALARPAAPDGSWVNADDVAKLARELDVAMNGEDGAALRPALCDVVQQACILLARPATPEQPVAFDEFNDAATADAIRALGIRNPTLKQVTDLQKAMAAAHEPQPTPAPAEATAVTIPAAAAEAIRAEWGGLADRIGGVLRTMDAPGAPLSAKQQLANIWRGEVDSLMAMTEGEIDAELQQLGFDPQAVATTATGAPMSRDAGMTIEQMRAHFEWWYTTRGVFQPIGSRECAAAWAAWIASGHYTEPGGWQVSPQPWGYESAATPEAPAPVQPLTDDTARLDWLDSQISFAWDCTRDKRDGGHRIEVSVPLIGEERIDLRQAVDAAIDAARASEGSTP